MKKTTFVIVLIVIAVLIAIWGCHDRINITSSLTDAMGGAAYGAPASVRTNAINGTGAVKYSSWPITARYKITNSFDPSETYLDPSINNSNYSPKKYLRYLLDRTYTSPTLIFLDSNVEICFQYSDTLVIPGNDVTPMLNIPSNVTLASDRGYNSSPGACIKIDYNLTDLEYLVNNPPVTRYFSSPYIINIDSNISNVRISGIRFYSDSVFWGLNFDNVPPKAHSHCILARECVDVKIDNNEFHLFQNRAISIVDTGLDRIDISGNFFSESWGSGEGYAIGIDGSNSGDAPQNVNIYYNYSENSRHFVGAGSKNPSSQPTYYAKWNYINNYVWGLVYDSENLNVAPHSDKDCKPSTAFDMHGVYHYCNNSSTPDITAGERIEIISNTIIGNMYNYTNIAVGIRGIPNDKCIVKFNDLQNFDKSEYPIRQGYTAQSTGDDYKWQTQNGAKHAEMGNMEVYDNNFGMNSKEHVYYILFNGEKDWKNMIPVFSTNDDDITFDKVRLVDTNNDNRTDFLYYPNSYWQGCEFTVINQTNITGFFEGLSIYSSYRAPNTLYRVSGTGISFLNMHFAYVNNDEAIDAIYHNGSYLQCFPGDLTQDPDLTFTPRPNWASRYNWITTGIPMERLRFGYFDGDGKIDVVVSREVNGINQWRWCLSNSSNPGSWTNIGTNNLGIRSEDCVVGDFDGDGNDELMGIKNRNVYIIETIINGSGQLTGTASPDIILSNTSATINSFKIANFDNQYGDDLMAAWGGTWYLYPIHKNSLPSGYTCPARESYRSSNCTFSNFEVGDFDGNGEIDFLLYSPSGSKVDL